MCGLYIPPISSPYFDDEIFEIFENHIEKFSRHGNIMILGDLNARTGFESDFVTKDGKKFITNDCSELSFDVDQRNNFDDNVNSHGKRLLDLCRSFDLNKLNGRT